MTDLPSEFARALAVIAHNAGRIALSYFRANPAARRKADGSFVTAADETAEALILNSLTALAPSIPVIAEEQVSKSGAAKAASRFFLVDPLDGTDEFIAGRDEFTVNIALIEAGIPVCGVVIAPAKQRA